MRRRSAPRATPRAAWSVSRRVGTSSVKTRSQMEERVDQQVRSANQERRDQAPEQTRLAATGELRVAAVVTDRHHDCTTDEATEGEHETEGHDRSHESGEGSE